MTIEKTSKNLASNYIYLEGDIPVDLPDGAFIALDRQLPLKVYALGFQPAKSIPEIPRWFLHKYATAPFSVLEPFAGSGTTILESLRVGASVYWTDYNPLSRLICQVKTTRFCLTEALTEAKKIVHKAFVHADVTPLINFSNKDFWFQPAVQQGLEILRNCIIEVASFNQPLFWLAFASTVRKVSDMNDGMILAAKRSNVMSVPERSKADVFKYFNFYVEKIVEALAQWQSTTPQYHEAILLDSEDARILPGNWDCDAVITSPPYINAIDYIWASKFELHWLGMVKTTQERLDLYAREIGTERIPTAETKLLGRTGEPELDQLIESIYFGEKYQASKGQNQLRARVVYQYFLDMQAHFSSCFTHVRPGGYYCFSIGDVSRICGVDIPVASLLTNLACKVGFQKEFCFHLLLKNRKLNIPRNVDWAGTIKHDTTIVLRKPK